MSSSMRNFVEAYAAVHNTEAKEELTSSRDCISEMNLSDLTDTDLDEIVEQVLEVMFSQGYSVDSAHLVFSEAFEESSIAGRQQKIERLCEALNRAFDVIDSKASTVALEEFAKYRNNKKLQESWSARFNQEKRIQRAHDRLVAAESLNVKTQLLKLVEGVMSMDKDDHDTGGFRISNKKAKEAEERVKMKKMDMKKEEVETIAERGPAVGGQRPKGHLAKRRAQLDAMGVSRPGTETQEVKKEEVSQIRKSWGDAYRSIYEKNDGNLANNYPPYDKVTRGDVIAGATGKDQKGGKKKAKMKKEEVEQVDENRAAARAAGGYKDDSKKQTDPSKAGFTGISGSIKDIMKQNKEIEAKNKMKKEEVESVDEALTGQRQMRARDMKGTPYQKGGGKRTARDNKTLHNLATRNEGPGTPGYEKKSTGGKGGKKFAGYGDQGAGNKAARRSGNEPMRGNRDPRKMGESVQFSEAELKAFEEIVNSWED